MESVLATDTINQGCNPRIGTDEEFMRFSDEAPLVEEGGEGVSAPLPWCVLIADDDEEVHLATAFVLRGVTIDSRPLQLLHAHSALEAEALLRATPHVAVAMLDVVMETTDAGLRLVEIIRKKIGLQTLRIILRTGQPGYAPELDVIRSYDINDYRAKSDLTQTRLITSLTSALRAYHQLEQIQAANRGMDAVAHASNELLRLRRMQDLARGLFEQIGAVLGIPAAGLMCVERLDFGDEEDAGLRVLYGCREYAALQGKTIDKALNVDMLRSIQRCVAARTRIFEPDRVLLWLGTSKSDAVAVFMLDQPLTSLDQRLLEMFSASLSMGFENVDLIERLDFFAYFDPLTRLPNRTRFLNEVNEALFVRRDHEWSLALADVLGFSEVNDALGHKCGDSLLVLIAKRLRSTMGPEVRLARISADTFGIFGPSAQIEPDTFMRAFEPVFFVHGHALVVQMRLGITGVGDCKGDAVELLRNASLALDRARVSNGKACVRFSADMSEDAQSRVSMLHNLRAAIDFHRGLSLHFQPILDVSVDKVLGLEAFIRWRDDRGVLLVPGRFIPLAEQTGLIGELGYWVIESALQQFSVWQRDWASAAYLSINVSSVQFREERMAERVLAALHEHDVLPSSLVLEINESICREDRGRVLRHLGRLRQAGVRIAFDDFGGDGFSLRQLNVFPLDMLKIERSFVEMLTVSDANLATVRAIVDLSRGRGLGVVAKCAETAEQVASLVSLDCCVMQGFHLCCPMGEKALEAWIQARSSGAAFSVPE